MQIEIIQIGKTKHTFFQAGEEEFLKRLQAFAKVKVITLKEYGVDDSSVEAQKQKARQMEANLISEQIKAATTLIILDETGQQFTSRDFATKIEKIKDFEGGKITIIIGGPFGLDSSIKKQANLLLSFSKFTFTHEQIRLLLLEQLYRAFTIINNKTYHY